MTIYFDYHQVSEHVSGLNSVSTLKKWRLKIEQLTGHTFQEDRIRTGKRSYSKVSSLPLTILKSSNKLQIPKESLDLIRQS